MNKILRILGKRGRITVPFEIRKNCGFTYNDILSFTQQDDNTVIVKREKLCDGCRGVGRPSDKNQDKVTLFDFLNGLSENEQYAARVYLADKWAQKRGGETLD